MSFLFNSIVAGLGAGSPTVTTTASTGVPVISTRVRGSSLSSAENSDDAALGFGFVIEVCEVNVPPMPDKSAARAS